MSQLHLNVNILYTQFCAARMYSTADLIKFVTVLLEYIIVLSKLLYYSS